MSLQTQEPESVAFRRFLFRWIGLQVARQIVLGVRLAAGTRRLRARRPRRAAPAGRAPPIIRTSITTDIAAMLLSAVGR
jgi:hypothetical protein